MGDNMNEELETKDMSNDFVDLDKPKNNNRYVGIVIILYVLVIILAVLLVMDLKKQKDVIMNSSQNYTINISIK